MSLRGSDYASAVPPLGATVRFVTAATVWLGGAIPAPQLDTIPLVFLSLIFYAADAGRNLGLDGRLRRRA